MTRVVSERRDMPGKLVGFTVKVEPRMLVSLGRLAATVPGTRPCSLARELLRRAIERGLADPSSLLEVG